MSEYCKMCAAEYMGLSHFDLPHTCKGAREMRHTEKNCKECERLRSQHIVDSAPASLDSSGYPALEPRRLEPPRKPTRMRRIGWQVMYPDGTEIGIWRAKSDTEKYVEALNAVVYPVYAKALDVKGSK